MGEREQALRWLAQQMEWESTLERLRAEASAQPETAAVADVEAPVAERPAA